MQILSTLILAAAVSFDGLGAGFAYGVRNLKVPCLSLLIISLSSSLALLTAMFLGRSMASLFSVEIASLMGAVILVIVGIYIIWGAYQGKKERQETLQKKGTTLRGLLKEPEKADFDSSGSISSREAAVLGLALAMDAFGAGFGAAMTGYSPLLTCVLVGVCKLLFVSGGVYVGKKYSESMSSTKASWLAGGVLMLLGIINII